MLVFYFYIVFLLGFVCGGALIWSIRKAEMVLSRTDWRRSWFKAHKPCPKCGSWSLFLGEQCQTCEIEEKCRVHKVDTT